MHAGEKVRAGTGFTGKKICIEKWYGKRRFGKAMIVYRLRYVNTFKGSRMMKYGNCSR